MKNILILDNSDDVLEMLTFVFKNEQFNLSTCNSIDSLYECLQSTIPDLMIIDIKHTGVRKNIICNDLRKRNALKNTPIIITSTNHSDIEDYQNFCANDALEKPFEVKELMKSVKSLLSLQEQS